jgi:hypothetical protein
MTQELSSTIYKTTDLALAASLLSCHCSIYEINRNSSTRRATFVFKLSSNQEKLINDFWSDSLSINPRLFFDNIKLLKNRLYSE